MDSKFLKFSIVYALRSIGRNKRRTLLTIGTIALSVSVSIIGSCYSDAVLKIWEDGVINHGAGHAQFHVKCYWDQQDSLVMENTMVGTGNQVVAQLQLDFAVQGLARVVGHHVDQASQRIGAKQRALWAAQNFNLLHVHGGGGATDAGEVHTINHQADRGIDRLHELAALANAANLDKAAARGAG